MLNPREENIPETCASTPGWFCTRAESRWRFWAESGFSADPPAGGMALELDWVVMAVTCGCELLIVSPLQRGRTGGIPAGGRPWKSDEGEAGVPGGFLGCVIAALSRLIDRKLSPGVT
jgi:hypothetical protein